MRDAMENLGLAPGPRPGLLRPAHPADPGSPGTLGRNPADRAAGRLYLADAPGCSKVLRGVAETVRSVLLIGHNPGLHELAVRLVGAHAMTYANPDLRRLAEGYPSGALAEFTVPGALGRAGRGRRAAWSASSPRATSGPGGEARLCRRARNGAGAPPPTRRRHAVLEFVARPRRPAALAPSCPSLTRVGPSRPVSCVWHDTPDGALRRTGLCLCATAELWRLERLRPGDGSRMAGHPASAILGRGRSPAALRPDAARRRRPGRRLRGPPPRLSPPAPTSKSCTARLRGVVAERKSCRLTLAAPAPALAAAGAGPRWRRCASPSPAPASPLEAVAVARGGAPPPRHPARPAWTGQTVRQPRPRANHRPPARRPAALDRPLPRTAEPEAVHQARVATRRLRSALSLYKRATACPELEALAPRSKHCAARLGAARDWDVFLEGTGARLAATARRPRLSRPAAHRPTPAQRGLRRTARLPRRARSSAPSKSRLGLRRQPAPLGMAPTSRRQP